MARLFIERHIGWIAACIFLAGAVAVAPYFFRHASPNAIPPPVIRTIPLVRQVPLIVTVPPGIDAASVDTVGKALMGDVALERDAAFLYVGAFQVRCHPEVGHSLAKLATRVGLPTMQAVGKLLDAQPAVARTLYSIIRGSSAVAPCNTPIHEWRVGSYRLRLSPLAYADGFPDSYFNPSITSDATTRPFYRDVDSPCLQLAFRLLPLDAEVPWQCASSRREARRQIVQSLCPADVAGAEGQHHFAVDVHMLKSRMPDMCQ
jgi:hypothetical protein